MDKTAKRMKAHIGTYLIDLGGGDCETVLDQLYQVCAESHESDPSEISGEFKEWGAYLCELPLKNNIVFSLCCRLCSAYEHKTFLDGLQYGAHRMLKLSEYSGYFPLRKQKSFFCNTLTEIKDT